jgi:hypothetical protein
MAESKRGNILKAIFAVASGRPIDGGGSTRKVQPAHTAGPYRARGASTTGGSSVGGIPANSQPLKWNERL